MALQQCGATLRRWGILRLGALAALPRAEVHARLGELGGSWQRLASGEDDAPLVPWLAEPVFEELVELEWPIEGFEPLSFVLARLLEPLSARLGEALSVEPSFLGCLLGYGPEPEPARCGAMAGTIEVLADPTAPMEDWEMLEQ